MCQNIVLPGDCSTVEILVAVSADGFNQQEATEIVDEHLSMDIWTSNGTTPRQLHVVKDAYTSCWNSMDGVAGVVSSPARASAGRTLVDLIFAVALYKVLKILRRKLTAQGVCWDVNIVKELAKLNLSAVPHKDFDKV